MKPIVKVITLRSLPCDGCLGPDEVIHLLLDVMMRDVLCGGHLLGWFSGSFCEEAL